MPQFHELADAFPLITGEAFDELKKDILDHGQLEPVVMFEGKILDGRNRWRAMQDLGLPHRETKLDKNIDPVAFVWSKNAIRRQLTPAQKALAATKLVTAKHGGQSANETKVTNAQAAELAGVGERAVKRAKRVLEQAAPEVVAAVENGELGLGPAEMISMKPPEVQSAIMKQGPKEAAKAVAPKPAPEPGLQPEPEPGPETLMVRQMTESTGVRDRTRLWAEHRELIAGLDAEQLKKFVTDLAAERRAVDQLLKLIKAETGAPATPRATGTAKGADVPTEPVKAVAKKPVTAV